jgi:hypothetical protein
MGSRSNNKRSFDRFRLRIQCEIRQGDQRTPGTVLDASPTGIFVLMSPASAPSLGREVTVVLKDTPAGDLTLLARVVRARKVRRELVAMARGGIGLQIYSAPEPYYTLLSEKVIAAGGS